MQAEEQKQTNDTSVTVADEFTDAQIEAAASGLHAQMAQTVTGSQGC